MSKCWRLVAHLDYTARAFTTVCGTYQPLDKLFKLFGDVESPAIFLRDVVIEIPA
jgi:hypothetical protein